MSLTVKTAFFVLTRRVFKVATGATEKFQPRTTSKTAWYISGPFSEKTATNCAKAALGTHTCLAANVIAATELVKEVGDYSMYTTGLEQIAKRMVARLHPEAVEGAA